MVTPDWILRLFADLRRMISPLEGKAVEAVCRDLTHDRYAVRERAMAEAFKMDQRLVLTLREYCNRHPSGELEQRIGVIAKHFAGESVPPLAARVIESAMYNGQFQSDLIFAALTGPAGTCRLADHVREKLPEQQKNRQEHIARLRKAER